MGKTYGQYQNQGQQNPNLIRPRQYSNQASSQSTPLRRVWVRRTEGNPTTILVGPNDIVDDLKLAVTNKFPNSLARYYDPADIQIQMLLKQSANEISGRKQKQNVSSLIRSVLETPEDSSNKLASAAKIPILSVQTSTIVLEPDQNVWDILDDHFGGTMVMADAFVIGVEVAGQLTLTGYSQYSRTEHMEPSSISIHLRHSPLNSQHYHQPKPQRVLESQQQARDVIGKNGSVSPNFLNGTSPLNNVGQHKRALSNPPFSPSSSNQLGKSGNSQAVLLLPKNFTLGEQNSLKRMSLDEGSTNTHYSDNGNSHTNSRNINVTNIGIGGHKQDLKLSKSLLRSGEITSSNSTENHGPTRGLVKGITLKPRASVDVQDEKENRDNGDKHAIAKSASSKVTNKPKEKSLKTSAFEKVLPSISVLVVEDNAINQAILGAFLRKHKIHYQIAKNGQEAVDKWRKGGFHLVLMDIQLPVKSGIEATKEIRYLEKINRIGVFAQHELASSDKNGLLELKEDDKLDLNTFRSPVIIVALTASSNSSVDKKNALTAGCNDFLTKPVNLVWLQNKITEWGCMQALIDFDGWKGIERSNSASLKTKPQLLKADTSPTEKSEQKKTLVAT